MKFIKSISAGISFVERSLLVFLLSSMVMLAFVQVILRNVFHTGLLWVDPFLRHLVLWLGFLGASLAAEQEKHINIDLITRFLSPRTTNLVRIITNLFAAVVCAALTRAGVTFLINEQSVEGALFSIGTMEFKAWWFQLIIPVGFGLLALRFTIRMIDHVMKSFRGALPPEPTANVPTIET